MRTQKAGMAWSFTLLLILSLLSSGCNFFGKKVDNTVTTVPGELPDGTSIVGTWSMSSSTLDPKTTTPASAATTTVIFDPSGAGRLEVRDQKSGGIVCTAFGQYRLVGDDNFILYVQSTSPAGACPFPAQINFSSIKVAKDYLDYVDPSTKSPYRLFKDRAQELAPVGVWDFAGSGGLDYLFLDQHGYFLLQASMSGDVYLLEGFYTVANGAITLSFIQDGDPGKVAGTEYFDQFVTNGANLVFDITSTSGTTTLTGTKR